MKKLTFSSVSPSSERRANAPNISLFTICCCLHISVPHDNDNNLVKHCHELSSSIISSIFKSIFSLTIVVRETCAFLVMEESWNKVWFISTWQNIVAGGCENCREMTSCFGTRSGSKKPLSFSATFLGLVIFKYRVEGRGAAKQRDEDHVS